MTQLLAGVVNVMLLAPVWMQLLHLLLADALWITLVLLGAVLLPQPAAGDAGRGPGGPAGVRSGQARLRASTRTGMGVQLPGRRRCRRT